jgi:uncharacterized protein (DUF779 family)
MSSDKTNAVQHTKVLVQVCDHKIGALSSRIGNEVLFTARGIRFVVYRFR